MPILDDDWQNYKRAHPFTPVWSPSVPCSLLSEWRAAVCPLLRRVSWLLGLLGCPASLEQPPGWRHTVSLCKVQLAILISVFQSRPCSGNQLLFLHACCPRFAPQHVFVSFLFFTSYLEFVFSVLCSCFHDGNDVIDLRSVLQHLEYLLSSYRSNVYKLIN